jgi:serine phosphatase RsbU (regulator of sigma subunit)
MALSELHNGDARRIAELEHELNEMTAALAQAYDQLVPFLQETPAPGTGIDLIALLESVMAAVDAPLGALFLMHEDGQAEWVTIPSEVVALHHAQPVVQHLLETGGSSPIVALPLANGKHSHWVFHAMSINGRTAGALGVGLNSLVREFNSVEMRTMQRMTERVAGQIVATRLAESTAREAQIAHELQIAGLIQRSIQPASDPVVEGVQFASYWQPTFEVGGDAWGWHMYTPARVAGFILDVAGKGITAALGAVSLHTALKMALRLHLPLADTLVAVNDEFYEPYTQAGLLATATIFAYDSDTRVFEATSAGHPPTLVRAGGAWHRWRAAVPPIGVLPVIAPTVQQMQLAAGDLAVLYSDGLSEVADGDRLFGDAGIVQAVPGSAHTASGVLRAIVTAVAQARGRSQPHDDQTLIVLAAE